MDPNKPQAPKNPRQSVGIYLAVILVVMLLVNAFLLPTLRSRSVHEVDYGTFLQMVEKGFQSADVVRPKRAAVRCDG